MHTVLSDIFFILFYGSLAGHAKVIMIIKHYYDIVQVAVVVAKPAPKLRS